MDGKTMKAIEQETPGQKRVRAALSGFPYSGGRLRLSEELTFDLVADNLETLSTIIRDDVTQLRKAAGELIEIQAAIHSVRKIFGLR